MLPVILLIALFLGGQPPPQEGCIVPQMTFIGEQIGDRFGETVAQVGDMDGDGYSDIAVGAHCLRGKGPMTGAVYLFSGYDGRKLGFFEGEEPFGRFGKSIASTELNGDGRIDLIVGAPHMGGRPLDERGRIYIFSGASGKLIQIMEGRERGEWFGYAISCMDVNGDGFEDLLVGAPGGKGDGEARSGRAYLYSGEDLFDLALFQGEQEGDWFGYALCLIDADADGCPDPIIAAPGHDRALGRDVGRIYAFSGADGSLLYHVDPDDPIDRFGASLNPLDDLTGDGIQDLMVGSAGPSFSKTYIIDGAEGVILYALANDGSRHAQAHPVVSVKDRNRDGIPELAMGASDAFSSAILLFSGRDGGLLERRTLGESIQGFGYTLCGPLEAHLTGYPRLVAGGNPFRNRGDERAGFVGFYSLAPRGVLRCMRGKDGGDRFGTVVKIGGDANGDGRADLLVGCPFMAGPAGERAGAVYLYSDLGGAPDLVLEGETLGSRFGESLSTIDDIDGDGRADFLIGAPGFTHNNAQDAGRLYIFSSSLGGLSEWSLYGMKGGDRLGSSVTVLGDVNGDSVSDILVSAPGHDEGEVLNAGRVLLASGRDLDVLLEVKGRDWEDRLGSCLGVAGDLNGDGMAEFLCTVPRSPVFEMEGRERVHVYSPLSERPLFTLKALKTREKFGASLQGIHDVNGDRIPDILVGAPGYRGGLGAPRGRVYLYSGADGGLLGHITGGMSGDALGIAICRVQDFDGDGIAEIALGFAAGESGGIYIIGSKDLKPMCRLQGEEGARAFGASLSAPPDFTPETALVLLVGASRSRFNGIPEMGAVYAFGSDLPFGEAEETHAWPEFHSLMNRD